MPLRAYRHIFLALHKKIILLKICVMVFLFQHFSLQRKKVRLVISSLYQYRKGLQAAAFEDSQQFPRHLPSTHRQEYLAHLVAKILHIKFRVTTIPRKLSSF